MENKQHLKRQLQSLPDTPGVYYFLGTPKHSGGGSEVLYIGKATSLADRVKSYFSKDIFLTRGPKIARMLDEATSVKFVQTDSVLEALIMEANEIKKLEPWYNSREKDDKSYNYIVITKEEFPRILIRREKELLKIENGKLKIAKQFGPFPHASELREALKIIRRIFPYRDEKCPPAPQARALRAGKLPRISASGQRKSAVYKPCFNAQLGLCPGPCAGWISKKNYRKNIKHITLFFEGKKDKLIRALEKEMKNLAKEQRFEEAGKIKRQLYALDHIQDVALIKKDIEAGSTKQESNFRIEAYDIAHLSGKETVGVMVVVQDGELDKSQYRKFRIRGRTSGAKGRTLSTDSQGSTLIRIDDTGNLKEVIRRRLGHLEWSLPNLMVVDGGVAQINAVKEVLKENNFNIDVVSVVKDVRHKVREIVGSRKYVERYGRAILLANSEAHRFAINYHRLLRRKGFRI